METRVKIVEGAVPPENVEFFEEMCKFAGLDSKQEFEIARSWRTFLALRNQNDPVGALSLGIYGVHFSPLDDLQFAGIFNPSVLNPSVAVILMIAVETSLQRKGIGTHLLKYAEDSWFQESEHIHHNRQILVATTNDNIPALSFYQKNDYKLIDVRIGCMVGHHSDEEIGIMGIPIRDVFLLSKQN